MSFARLANSILLVSAASLMGCAFMGSYQTENAQYRRLINQELHEERLFVRGEQRLAMKALVGSREMRDLQSTVSPGFEFNYKPDKHQVIVAVSSQNRIPFMRDELKFLLDDEPAQSVEELTSNFLLQTLYPFAYPYYRVFMVEFKGNSSSDRGFELQSSRGALGVKLQFSPVSQNPLN